MEGSPHDEEDILVHSECFTMLFVFPTAFGDSSSSLIITQSRHLFLAFVGGLNASQKMFLISLVSA